MINEVIFGKTMSQLARTQLDIAEVCEEVKALLLDKNKKYGDSALNPVRVFSKADVLEQIKVRMDDKLSRIRTSAENDSEDAYLDLIGYLVLYRVALRQKANPYGETDYPWSSAN